MNDDAHLDFDDFSVFGAQLRELVEISGRTRSEKQEQLIVEKGRQLDERLRRFREHGLVLDRSTFAMYYSRIVAQPCRSRSPLSG